MLNQPYPDKTPMIESPLSDSPRPTPASIWREAASAGAWRYAFVLTAVLGGLYFASAQALPRAVLFTLGQGLASIAALVAVRLYRPSNAGAWLVIAGGLGLVTIGTAITLGVPAVGGSLPYPSIGDAFYVGGYLFVIGGVWWLVKSALGSPSIDSVIDALIVTIAVGLVSWALVMDPLVDANGTPLDVLLVSLAYPLLDVLMLGLLAQLVFTPGTKLPSLWLIGLAIGAGTASDFGLAVVNATGAYSPGTLVDVGWWVAVAGWAAAAMHPSMGQILIPVREATSLISRRRLAFLTGAALVPPLVLGYQELAETVAADIDVMVATTIVMILLVVWRLRRLMMDLRTSLEARVIVERELKFRTLHDPLTGLPNRVQFAERLDGMLRESPNEIAVLFCDLDDFKNVNDTLGHPAGDALLTAVGARIGAVMRPGDLAARLGGDEFAILLEGVKGNPAAQAVADRVLAALAVPISIDGHELTVRASIGIARSSDGVHDALDLMRSADIAMYLAKSSGKSRAEFFQESMHADVLLRMSLRNDLDHAIADHQFSLVYQPIVDLSTGELEGAEALVRWDHPTHGQLPPFDFIPIAETSGLIVPLGRWILSEACRQAATWKIGDDEGFLSIAVNVSTRQLDDPEFVASVRAALEETGLEPGRLILEVTETALADAAVAERVLTELRELGVRTALDDFGTGYSSLTYIERFPIDIIKIDRSFVAALDVGSRESKVVSAIVDLAGRLDMQTVAEGIESTEQLERLQGLGCKLGQGFLLARPQDSRAFDRLVRHQPPMDLRPEPMPRPNARQSARAGYDRPKSAPLVLPT